MQQLKYTPKMGFKLLVYALITVIVFLSFRAFSPYLSPSLNSDNAVHILMAYDLKLPEDLYYWGQDRLGSLVPIVGHGLITLFSLEPIIAVSVAHYFFLIVGFLSFSFLLNDPISKLIFALIWFLPFKQFTALVKIGQPYGPQFALIAFGLVCFDQLFKRRNQLSEWSKHGLLSIGLLALFGSLWISDFSIVAIFTLIVYASIEGYRAVKRRSPYPNSALSGSHLRSALGYGLNIALVSATGTAFILYAKHSASSRKDYAEFNTVGQILEILQHQIKPFFGAIAFRSRDIWISIFSLCILIFIVAISLLFVQFLFTRVSHQSGGLHSDSQQPKQPFNALSAWTLVFFSNALIGYGLLILSHWVYSEEKGFGERYFTFVYVMLWMAVLLLREGLNSSLSIRFAPLLLIAACSASLTLPAYVYSVQKVESKYSRLQELRDIAPAGIIGEYMQSYVLCSADPDALDCTRYDRKGGTPCLSDPASQKPIGRVRCERCVDEVFAAPQIYLVKDKWLESFPSEIQQFGRCLVPVGDAISQGGYTLMPYRQRYPIVGD